MKSRHFRKLSCTLLALVAGQVSAAGLGVLQKSPSLGDSLALRIEIINTGKGVPDASCFALKAPEAAAGSMEWVKTARLQVKPGQPALLEIRSETVVREPVMRFAVELGCGSHVTREYTVLASPRKNPKAVEVDEPAPSMLRLGEPSGTGSAARPAPPPRRAPEKPAVPPAVVEPKLPETVTAPTPGVSPTAPVVTEPPAVTAVPSTPPVVEPAPAASAPASPPAPAPVVPPPVAADDDASWLLPLVLVAGVLGVLGFLFYRRKQDAQSRDDDFSLLGPAREPSAATEADDGGDRQAFTVHEMSVFPSDLEMPAKAVAAPAKPDATVAETTAAAPADSAPQPLAPLPEIEPLPASVVAESVAAMANEKSDSVNPVMELAEIMLSFGRVKGAAQALQEYIDKSPEEALQPWIRLLDVYRMAGMREEFDTVARNLNQTFNVELQSWDEMEAAAASAAQAAKPAGNLIEFTLDEAPSVPMAPVVRPQSIEDMPRVLQQISENWASDGVIELMHGLLRDNRGGTRLGFARPVVEELLFLIDLCETRRKMDAN